jgi:hypothetical protein
MNLTIDASIFVSSARPYEELYKVSFQVPPEYQGNRDLLPGADAEKLICQR